MPDDTLTRDGHEAHRHRERVRAERTLRESEERFRRLAEATFEGILIIVEGRIVDANKQMARMIGFPIERIIGTKVGTRVAHDQREMVIARHFAAHDDPYEITVYRSDRTPITVELRGKTIPYGEGRARVVAMRDISARRRLEEQLRQAQKMEAIGRVSAGIAHDFNNLLTAILSYGELLADEHEPASKHHRYAREIVRITSRAGELSRQLLAFGREQPRKPEIVDLSAVVTSMEGMLRRVIRSDVVLEIEPAPRPARIEADPGQLEQVILNLAINARDAMPEGGTLKVTTADVELDAEAVAHDPDLAPGPYVRLTVSDDGVGMTPETRTRIFEPFFSTKTQDKGTGLGLATVYGIVKQSGGGITVDSEPGRGTVFRLDFPRAASPDSR